MQIRQYKSTDTEAIAAVYRNSVLNIGCDFYRPEQVKIWASFPNDLVAFNKRLQQGLTLIIRQDNIIAAFGQLYPDYHISLLYTAKDYARKGYAKLIYQELEKVAIARDIKYLTTEASRVSKYFFLKQGFAIIEPEIVLRQGMEFERFKMKKIIA